MPSKGGAQLDDVLMADVSGWEYEVRATYISSSAAQAAKVTADLTAQNAADGGRPSGRLRRRAGPGARSGQPVKQRSLSGRDGAVRHHHGGSGTEGHSAGVVRGRAISPWVRIIPSSGATSPLSGKSGNFPDRITKPRTRV